MKNNIEKKIQETDKKLKEFSITLKQLDLEYQQVLEELALTPEQLQEFVSPDQFSPIVWEMLQEEQKEWDERLNLELNNIRDPLNTQKAIEEKGHVQQHWLFVR
jgi:hypothetical protein